MFEQVIPKTGAKLIAGASTANQLVIDKIVASSLDSYSLQELKNDPSIVELYTRMDRADVIVGDIDGASVMQEDVGNEPSAVARVVGSLGPTGTSEFEAHLICIWAHPANGTEYEQTHPEPLVWAYSQDDALVIPKSIATVRAVFNIAVMSETVVDSVSHGDGYLTFGDANGYMSTHLPGDLTHGKFQYVYGEKQFMDPLAISNQIKFVPGKASIRSEAESDESDAGILVQINSPLDSGVDARLFGVVDEDSGDDYFGVWYEDDRVTTHIGILEGSYGRHVHVAEGSDIIAEVPYESSLGSASGPFNDVWAAVTHTNNIRPLDSEEGVIRITTDTQPVTIMASSGNNALTLGASSRPIETVYAGAVSTNKIYSTVSTAVWAEIATNAQGITLTPNVANTGCIGTANKPFSLGFINQLYTSNIYIGNQQMNYAPNIPNTPTSGDTANVLIGSTVMAMGTYGDFGKGAGSSIQYGERITVPSSRIHVAANRAGDFTISSKYIPSGAYVAISEADFGTGSNDRSVVALIRIG